MTLYFLDSHHAFDGMEVPREYMILHQTSAVEGKNVSFYATATTEAEAVVRIFPELVDVGIEAILGNAPQNVQQRYRAHLHDDPHWAIVRADELGPANLRQVNHAYNRNCFQDYTEAEIRKLFGIKIRWGVLQRVRL